MTFRCYECGRFFKTKRALDAHCVSLNHPQEWPCQQCDRIFVSPTARDAHTHALHNNQCKNCQIWFSWANQLEAHESKFHKFNCKECNKSFESEEDQKNHDRNFHFFPCTRGTCERIFRTSDARKAHNSAIHNFACRYCKNVFDTYAILEKHAHNKHNQPVASSVKEKTDSQEAHKTAEHIKCAYCEMVFESHGMLEKHQLQSHVYPCIKCGQKFLTADTMNAHYFVKHHFTCSHCSMVFDDKAIYEVHKALAHQVTCKKCGESFQDQEMVKIHIKSAHNFRCSKCSDSFDTLDDLKQHDHASHPIIWEGLIGTYHQAVLNTQTAPALSSMESANGRLEVENVSEVVAVPGSSEHLVNGPPVVSGDQQPSHHTTVECETCLLKFDSLAKLLDHNSKTHTMPCPVCSQRCEGPVSLLQHFGTNHLVKCKSCNAAFEQPDNLQKHILEAHSVQCPTCLGRFADQIVLVHHQLALHMLKCEFCKGTFFDTLEAQDEHYSTVHPLRFASDTTPSSARSTHSSTEKSTSALRTKTRQLEHEEAQPSSGTKTQPKEYTPGKGFTQTILHKCQEKDCLAEFDTEAELDRHMKHSPFHGAREMQCYECNMIFTTQYQLLQHIESEPHQAIWVLSLVSMP